MTDEQVKKELEEIALKTTWGGFECVAGVPKPIAVIQDALALINRLEEENKDLRQTLDIANERMYRKKFIKEIWQDELGNDLSVPDLDFVYQLFFEQRKQIEQIRKETPKVMIEELEYYSSYENTDLKGGISCLKQYAHEKYGVEIIEN